MSKIKIKDTKNADSRTADSNLTKKTLYDATINHIDDVKRGMDYIADEIKKRGREHDFTKIGEYFDEYSTNVLKGEGDESFKQEEWYQKHITLERHHVCDQAGTDVDLIDIIEHLVDVTMAGLGRSGYVSSKYSDINPLLLYRAYWNTIRRLEAQVEIVE